MKGISDIFRKAAARAGIREDIRTDGEELCTDTALYGILGDHTLTSSKGESVLISMLAGAVCIPIKGRVLCYEVSTRSGQRVSFFPQKRDDRPLAPAELPYGALPGDTVDLQAHYLWRTDGRACIRDLVRRGLMDSSGRVIYPYKGEVAHMSRGHAYGEAVRIPDRAILDTLYYQGYIIEGGEGYVWAGV